ncbi:down syndrome cell adhesion molecule-like protein Dscam2 [Trichonephila clavipes]|nr:down syndrome cell adhesion molecule-like protein Dscam2 [Trichonephila clavipes]
MRFLRNRSRHLVYDVGRRRTPLAGVSSNFYLEQLIERTSKKLFKSRCYGNCVKIARIGRKFARETGNGPTPGVSGSEDQSNGFLYSSPRWVVSSNGSLVIAQSQESDAGVYACQVENGIGPGISKNIALKVNGE